MTTQVRGVREIDYLPIGGKRIKPATDKLITVISPWSEDVVATVPDGSEVDVDRAVASALGAQNSPGWGRSSVGDRVEVMKRFADLYRKRKHEVAEAMTLEMGCPRSQVIAMHVDPAVGALEYYADLMRAFPFSEYRSGKRLTLVRRPPVGVSAAIVPWNGPALLAMLKVAPALAAGCAVVLKPSPEAPLTAFVLADIAAEAGLPDGALNVVPAGREVSEYLVRHPDVRKVSFTGSTGAGRRVGELCGAALKHVNLELGGKSAAIVLEDADLQATVDALRLASFANAGQVCTARTRVFVPWSKYDEFCELIATMADNLVVGDPEDERTQMGPLVTKTQQDRVLGYIQTALADGARRVTTREVSDVPDSGWFVPPTVFADVTNDMTIAQEEVFGPVVSVIGYESIDDAVTMANDTEFGLSGSVFTADAEVGFSIAERIESGTFGINDFGNDMSAPFGGVKASGLGREMGPEGLEEYLEFQSVLVPKRREGS